MTITEQKENVIAGIEGTLKMLGFKYSYSSILWPSLHIEFRIPDSYMIMWYLYVDYDIAINQYSIKLGKYMHDGNSNAHFHPVVSTVASNLDDVDRLTCILLAEAIENWYLAQ